MYRRAGWLSLTLVCLPWKNNKKANLTKNQHLGKPWRLIRMGGSQSCSRNHRVHEVEWLVARVGKHLVPSLRWAEWLFWEWDLLDTTLSDVWETPILSVFVQGDKCVLYFHTTNTTENGLLKLKLDISLVPPPLLHPSFIHPTSPLYFWSSHLVLLSWGDIHSCWNGGKGTVGRKENTFLNSYRARRVSWFSFCFLLHFFSVISLAMVE